MHSNGSMLIFQKTFLVHRDFILSSWVAAFFSYRKEQEEEQWELKKECYLDLGKNLTSRLYVALSLN